MFFVIKLKKILALSCIIIIFCVSTLSLPAYINVMSTSDKTAQEMTQNQAIKWVDFRATAQAMSDALDADINAHNSGRDIKFADMVSYLATKYGNNFKAYKKSDITNLVNRISEGETLDDITKDMKNFDYYEQVYHAVLGQFVGTYFIETEDEQNTEGIKWVQKYGLKVYFPIAKTFPYSDFDDFGTSRTYGFKRKHLGHDMMGQVGTPIIAVESGIVEEIGWNRYGGWRLGIRSFDSNRYYYYAHMRQNRPYHESIYQGKFVNAGDVIGYLGRTGYSNNENINNIETPHLHWGMELIFDELRRKEGKEIWIDVYEITKFLQKNKSKTVRNDETREYSRKYNFLDTTN